MPKSKSLLADKLGQAGRKAVQEHRKDETVLDTGGDLPAGISGGVARLVMCKFDTYKEGDNKGKPYFMAAGVVVSPKEFDGQIIEGLRTQIGPEPLCDTPKSQGKRKTVGDRIAWVLNELRKLGVETEGVEIDDLDSIVEQLQEDGPHFRFRTWKGKATKQYPDPRTQHVWNGLAEGYEGGDSTADVIDNTDASEEEVEVEEEEEASEEEEVSLEELGAAADDGDSDAIDQLTELAESLEIDHESLETYAMVAEAIAEAQEGGEEEEEAEEEEEEESSEPLAKGDVCHYKPPKGRKLIECEVTSVLTKAQTYTLKNLDDNKTIYKSVPWDAVS